MAEAIEKVKHNWIAWSLGVGGAVITAGLIWIIQFLVFGFEEYVKDVAAQNTVPVATQTQINNIENAVTTISAQFAAEAERNKEFREQQQEDMRNLVSIISRGTQ